jgi:hypothetical protein
MNLTQYEARLRQLPCVVGHHIGAACRCETLHHVGMPEDRDDANQVPLCDDHHQGPNGVHGLHRREFAMRYRLSDLRMLAITRRLYLREFGA